MDPDTGLPSNIRYQLAGELTEGQSPLFYIDSWRKIFLTRPLDRDGPSGRTVYEFNVLATDERNSDEKLIGVAVVKVKPIDINDNSPMFESNTIQGGVLEGSELGNIYYRFAYFLQ